MPVIELIADVFLRPPETYGVKTQPGRRLHFLYGHADIFTEGDLEYVLNMPNAVVRPTDRFVGRMKDLLEARTDLNPPKATIDIAGVLQTTQEFLSSARVTPGLAPPEHGESAEPEPLTPLEALVRGRGRPPKTQE